MVILILNFYTLIFITSNLFSALILTELSKADRTRLTYNCAHLRSTKESLTDSVKNLFVQKNFCVNIEFVG